MAGDIVVMPEMLIPSSPIGLQRGQFSIADAGKY